MAVQDECILRIVGRFQSQNISQTLHYRIMAQAAPDKTILQSLCTGWNTTFGTAWAAAHSTAYELIGLKAFRKTGDSKTPGYLALGTAGTVTGDAAPAFCCRTITMYTTDAKFRRRGRLMLSGSPVAHFDTADGSLTDAAKLLLDAIGALLPPSFTFAGDEFQAGLPAVAPDTWQDCSDTRSRETPSNVKSRRVRRFSIG